VTVKYCNIKTNKQNTLGTEADILPSLRPYGLHHTSRIPSYWRWVAN